VGPRGSSIINRENHKGLISDDGIGVRVVKAEIPVPAVVVGSLKVGEYFCLTGDSYHNYFG